MTRILTLAAATAATLALAACSAAGAPSTSATASLPTNAVPSFAGDPDSFAVMSDDVAADGALSTTILGQTSPTCDGDGESLHLEWTEPPAGTQSYAVIFENTTHDVVYWARYNIAADETGFAHGSYGATSGREALNDIGVRYPVAPCPDDAEIDEYLLTVWALDAIFDEELRSYVDLREAIPAHSLATATLEAYAAGIEP